MRSATVRLFIIIASVLIAVIITMQVFWLNKMYTYENNSFRTSVVKVIRGVYEDLPLLYEPTTRLQALIQQSGPNTFMFRIDSLPQTDSLLYYVSAEMEDFDIFTDCQLGIYSVRTQSFNYHGFLKTAVSSASSKIIALKLPKSGYSYVYLHFPRREKYIVSQMRSWIFGSVVLLMLLLGFAASLYYFFKQKFLVEIQRDFINNVTHEFSTPLSVIELSVEGLENPAILGNPERHGKYVTSIGYQAEYLKKHISNLISTVVADKYDFIMKMSTVTPNALLRKAVAQLEPLLSKKNGRVEWDLSRGQGTIEADEENLYLAFFNILNNAIKYSDRPEIWIVTSSNGSFTVRIRDNGVGIDPKKTDRIFDKFYRIQDGDVHNVKGLGLGLYFTRKVIDGHGGRISVRSEPGKGSEFIIELPVKRS